MPGMRAVVISEFGGPEQLKLVEDHPQPEPGDGQVLIKVSRAGINFADTHARENSYLASYELPLIPGTEVAGEVDGRRVVALTGTGGYAEYAVAPEQSAFPIPDGVSDNAALGIVVQGLSAWHLLKTSSHLAEGETVVVHAAAGGVGTIAVQLAKRYGAGRVIATASTEEKRALALELGADAAVDPNAEDLNAALREANGGNKVDIVLEMAGGRVFDQSMRALAPFGRLVTYGLASREPNQVSNGALMRRSQAVVGFWLMHCFARPQEMIAEPLRELFGLAAAGDLRVVEGETYGLSRGPPRARGDAGAAHAREAPARPVAVARGERQRRLGRRRVRTASGGHECHLDHPYGGRDDIRAARPAPSTPYPAAVRQTFTARPSPRTRLGPNPATRTRSPTVRYGPAASRSSTIRRAPTGPMPGSRWSSEASAALRSMRSSGGSGGQARLRPAAAPAPDRPGRRAGAPRRPTGSPRRAG